MVPGAQAGLSTIDWPMLGPDIVDVATRGPVAPAVERVSVDTSELAGHFTVFDEMTAAASVMPVGLVRVANRAVVNAATSSEPGAVVVTVGAVMVFPLLDDSAPEAWTGDPDETPEQASMVPTAAGLALNCQTYDAGSLDPAVRL